MKWIEVKDELPKKEDVYLIWPHDKYAGFSALFWPYPDSKVNIEKCFYSESEYGEVTNLLDVTHWMPLPDKPTAAQGEGS